MFWSTNDFGICFCNCDIKGKLFYLTFLEEPCGVLLIKLAGVELTETGKVWLQKELKPSQVLWFQLLGKENSALFCYLLVNKVSSVKKELTIFYSYYLCISEKWKC